jgi:hypothetical protein
MGLDMVIFIVGSLSMTGTRGSSVEEMAPNVRFRQVNGLAAAPGQNRGVRYSVEPFTCAMLIVGGIADSWRAVIAITRWSARRSSCGRRRLRRPKELPRSSPTVGASLSCTVHTGERDAHRTTEVTMTSTDANSVNSAGESPMPAQSI